MSGIRVCRIVDSFPRKDEIKGDLGPNYYYYSKLSAEQGIDVHVICGRKAGQPESEEVNGISVHRVSGNLSWWSINYGDWARNAYRKVLELKPDIVHGHNAFHIPLVRKRSSLHQNGIKIITHLHGAIDGCLDCDKFPFSFSISKGISNRISARQSFMDAAYASKNADFVIACDKYTANSVLRRFPQMNGRTFVAYNGVDMNVFRHVDTDLKQRAGIKHMLLSIGRPVPFKGFKYVLKGMKELNREFDGLKLVLIGVKRQDFGQDIYYRWLESTARKLGITNVDMMSTVNYFNLPEYYSAADCFVTASYPDSSPKVVYEAQACNTPVVAPNGGGIPEIFSPESGLLFGPRNVGDMVDKVRTVLNNPSKFRNGRKAVEGIATWEKCVKDIIRCYAQVVA
jgi:glycosyltransferase involved in cell wall biosynthesis